MNNMVKMVVTLSLISALAAGALAFADKMTRKKIAMQAKLKAARAVKKIFPDCAAPVERIVKSKKGEAITVYDCPGQKACFIFSSNSASGISRPYSGLIRVMVGVDSRGTIEGVEVITQSETPGLGANIEEKSWIGQFKGLSLTKGKLAVKKVDRTGSIDAISGATISSKAVTGIVKAALEFYAASGGKSAAPSEKARNQRFNRARQRKHGVMGPRSRANRLSAPLRAIQRKPRGKRVRRNKKQLEGLKLQLREKIRMRSSRAMTPARTMQSTGGAK
ncbi:RnfABCDGE type electron transport complex subunit G [Myxococcota bacterium]|nr:RnfABCDGE type electron transport complex subunit G [Myxococcota bacterium]MBU1537255.1 RnfABCDGE type electron transport complex subunit G [Myxococcota bacterium]